jgi:P27 family predicted phage terminase small subunit
MGARGPAPQPTALKILRGNPGKRALNRREVKPRPVAPKMPPWLDDEAKREWRRMAPRLERVGLLTEQDGACLAGYCMAWARWQAAEALVTKLGLVIKTGSETYTSIKANPAVSIAQAERHSMLQFGARLGLSPSDRGRMQLRESDDDDGDDLLD